MKIVFLFIFNITLYGATIDFKSNPSNAKIFATNSDNGTRRLIGKTPYKGDLDILKKTTGTQGTILVSIEKNGFNPFNIVVPVIYDADIALNADLKVEKDVKLTQDFDFLIGDLFDVLRMMRTKDFSSAIAKLNKLDERFPYFSVIPEMKGGIYYMKKDYKNSLNFYRKAFGINPKNHDAYKMKSYLEKRFGIQEKI